jgi:non-ribosomal peptide synthetase component F
MIYAVGVPAAGQASSGKYGLVGHCVNLLPIRAKILSQQTFVEYLKKRKGAILDAYDHQEFTFGRLVQKLPINRDPSRIPLVSIMTLILIKIRKDQILFLII